jgi:cell division protein ZapA (FtsZ GTPase activity inhibitor)
VRIAGHDYKIRSDGDPEALRRIAGYVDRSMHRVKEGTGTVDSLDVAVLTCLNLAREILALREERVPAGSTVVEVGQLRGLIERVEAILPGASQADQPGVEAEVAQPSAPQRDLVAAEGQAAAGEPAAARTLELPMPEVLRERGDDANRDVVDAPVQRVAASGGDRSS